MWVGETLKGSSCGFVECIVEQYKWSPRERWGDWTLDCANVGKLEKRDRIRNTLKVEFLAACDLLDGRMRGPELLNTEYYCRCPGKVLILDLWWVPLLAWTKCSQKYNSNILVTKHIWVIEKREKMIKPEAVRLWLKRQAVWLPAYRYI
jgi:hypothetical protein